MNPPPLDLWSDRGISHQEIRARLTERSDQDVLGACTWLRAMGVVDEETRVSIVKLAELRRSSRLVLDAVEPALNEHLRGHPRLPQLLELHALMVEACVRVSEKLYPERN